MKRLKNSIVSRVHSAPISSKILLIVLATSILSLGLIAGSSVYREFQMATQREVENLGSIAGILASNTVASLRFEDIESASETLSSLEKEKDITCAILSNAEKVPFAEYHRDEYCIIPHEQISLGTNFNGNSITLTQSINLSENLIGFITIRADHSNLWNQLLTSLIIHSCILILSLVAALLLAKRLLPLITAPVEELVNLSRRVSEERNYELRAPKRNDDEIGILVDSINFMLSSIRERDQAIHETNRNLEELVADRTVKLVKSREKAEKALEAKSEFLATISHELRTPMNAIIGMSSVLQFDDLDPNRTRQLEIIQKSSGNLLNLINDILDFSKIEANRLELEHCPFDLVACVEEALDISSAAKKENRLIYCSSFDPTLPSHLKGDVSRLRQILVNLLSNAFKFTQTGSVTIEANRLAAERNRSERIQISVRDTGIGIPEDRITSIFESFTQADKSTSRNYGGTGLGLTISYRLALAMGGDIKVESEVGTGSVFHLTLPICRVEDLNTTIGKPLAMESKFSVCIRDLPAALDSSLRKNLMAWGCKVMGLEEEKRSDPDLTIASAISDDEFRAVEKATRLENKKRVTLIAHSDHSFLIQKTTTANVLTLPIRNRDLRNLLLKYVDTKEKPLYDPTQPFARYQTEKWRDLRILLAEDNELSRNVFMHHMELIGLEIDTASNGISAGELALENDYDIIFMDVRMPQRDGLQTARFIRKGLGQNRNRPWIVGFTANTESEALLAIEKSGMDDYLSKPALISDIAESIDRSFFAKGDTKSVLKDA